MSVRRSGARLAGRVWTKMTLGWTFDLPSVLCGKEQGASSCACRGAGEQADGRNEEGTLQTRSSAAQDETHGRGSGDPV